MKKQFNKLDKKISRRFLTATGIILIILVFPNWLLAQSIWVDPIRDKTISLEILKPSFAGKDNSTFATSVWFLTWSSPLGKNVRFVAELPFVHGGEKASPFLQGISENTIGNPYLGVELGKQNSSVFSEVGLRLPLASERKFFASVVGSASDLDRFEAFLPEVLTLNWNLNYRYKLPSGLVIRLRGGPSLLIETDKTPSEGAEKVFLGYSAQVGYESHQFSFLGGITGLADMRNQNLSFAERSIHQLGFAANFGSGTVRPGFHIRIPLDKDLADVEDVIYGLNFTIGVK